MPWKVHARPGEGRDWLQRKCPRYKTGLPVNANRITLAILIMTTGAMAKDSTDFSTVDFIPAVLNVTRGQVLMDRQRHVAIVAKKGKNSAHLVHVRSGVLKMTRHTAREIVETWSEADYPFDRALAKLLELGRQHGITDAARNALEDLVRAGQEPHQHKLFD